MPGRNQQLVLDAWRAPRGSPRAALSFRRRPDRSRSGFAGSCGLDDDIVVSVTELACRKDGCPDIETVIGIMRPGEKIETIRVNKAIADVTSHDLRRG